MIVQLKTRVQSDNRIVIPADGFEAGQDVKVTVESTTPNIPPSEDILDFIDSLPPGPRSGKTWEEVEQNFREERDAWDRE